MIGKILFVAGAATGYVLGSRAGRETYEKLKVRADKFWNSDKVQSGIKETKSRVAEKTPELRKKAEDALRRGPGSGSGVRGSGANVTTGASDTGTDTKGMDSAGHSGSTGTGTSDNVRAGKPGV
jgi:hypothetical protein